MFTIKPNNFHFVEPLEELEKIEKLIIHHTSRVDFTAEDTHRFHQNERGWSGIGYNYFIEKDGSISEGRGLHVGAHTYGYNRKTIGICATGDFDIENPTNAQIKSLIDICHYFMGKYQLKPKDVLGHRELDGFDYTTCPGKLFNMNEFRTLLEKVQVGASKA
ncbi:peptidoglycan recognition family protein [Bacillus sp. DTU_2020_1000418_1_SI_GHA_SEK_038]|uniref:peptidoglycan recognition protein family protein n=1 Tax=Bacillus sp. DTU_2020_1000418_1_SI_GHA_SEK_038 TaxID=3077585 RepID=UPI0028EF40E6|nr:peptidoglycan recognition family protein [Bacillus sp. DTU_2020_1000418_1_SI_GHA_SEK_038]WNS76072.1 peptidoglycan recognition family protein [Bacillus sp. DTU_2020_1000418_1_SI_GHA_SEK_038]